MNNALDALRPATVQPERTTLGDISIFHIGRHMIATGSKNNLGLKGMRYEVLSSHFLCEGRNGGTAFQVMK